MKKKMNRRAFAKMAAGAALAGTAAKEALAGRGAAQSAAATAPTQAAQDNAARAPEPRVKMTPEQEEQVKQAVERRERQLNTLRNFKLDYSAEPAFVFKVRK